MLTLPPPERAIFSRRANAAFGKEPYAGIQLSRIMWLSSGDDADAHFEISPQMFVQASSREQEVEHTSVETQTWEDEEWSVIPLFTVEEKPFLLFVLNLLSANSYRAPAPYSQKSGTSSSLIFSNCSRIPAALSYPHFIF